jgi:hypothetical protein
LSCSLGEKNPLDYNNLGGELIPKYGKRGENQTPGRIRKGPHKEGLQTSIGDLVLNENAGSGKKAT